jgi:flagellar biosynthetic protein FliS
MSTRGYASYNANSAQLARPGTQVALLLTAAARHVDEARRAMEVNDFEARFHATERASTILTGLRGCPSRHQPGAPQIAEVLDGYYARMLVMLVQVNVKNDKAAADQVIESLRTMATTSPVAARSSSTLGPRSPRRRTPSPSRRLQASRPSRPSTCRLRSAPPPRTCRSTTR